MERNITESPDKWVMIKITSGDKTYYKIFATWFGGYLDGDSWKINSGISSIEEDDDFYYFNGFSGSCYKCLKSAYGVATSYTSSMLELLIKKSNGLAEIMDDDTNWNDLNFDI